MQSTARRAAVRRGIGGLCVLSVLSLGRAANSSSVNASSVNVSTTAAVSTPAPGSGTSVNYQCKKCITRKIRASELSENCQQYCPPFQSF